MAIDERARHKMYLKFEEVFGPEVAAIAMGHLPPAGWGDVATSRDIAMMKRDLEHFAEINRQEHDVLAARLREEMRAMGERFQGSLRSLTMWLAGTMIGVATVALVIARVT